MNNIINKKLILPNVEYYQKHLEIINQVLPVQLTSKEVEVLANFMSLDKTLIGNSMFNSHTRKIVREKLNLSPGGLGNYLNTMIKKKFLLKDHITGIISVQSFLLPVDDNQGYQFLIQKQK